LKESRAALEGAAREQREASREQGGSRGGVGESSEGVLGGERYCKATAPSENSCGLSFWLSRNCAQKSAFTTIGVTKQEFLITYHDRAPIPQTIDSTKSCKFLERQLPTLQMAI